MKNDEVMRCGEVASTQGRKLLFWRAGMIVTAYLPATALFAMSKIVLKDLFRSGEAAHDGV
jgi:hypothetical protein